MFFAWEEFSDGKTRKEDVLEFKFKLEDNIFRLHRELKNKTYEHSHYSKFFVQDPKLRIIHKASVRDRVLHHAVFRIIYPFFDKGFIFDSYSCRTEKGTHRAVNRLEKFCRKLSKNNTKNIFILKCDIKKFFDSVDQNILLELVKNKIKDDNAIWLIEKIIKSFVTSPRPLLHKERGNSVGLPLGNVTSQVFANIYLNELDQFVKHKLKVKYYLRHCDDFLFLAERKDDLEKLILPIGGFLKKNLKLMLHPNKIIIRKYSQGIDFLGYVVLPHFRVLRTKTKRRMFKKIRFNKEKLETGDINEDSFNQSLQSYYGMLKHCKGRKLEQKIKNIVMPS